MAETVWSEHGLAVALKAKGEITVAPLVGLVTVTAAKAGTAQTSVAILSGRQKAFIQGPDRSSEHTGRRARSCLLETGGAHIAQGVCPGGSLIDLIDR